jgi:hypothetical protein
MRRLGLGGAAAIAIGLGVAACGTPTDSNGNEESAQVRLMNAAEGSPALDLTVGGVVVIGGIGYQQASPLATIPGGTQTLAIRRAGEQTALVSRSIPIIANARYTFVVGGSLASSLSLTPSITVDTGLAKPDRANLRIINIGGDVPTDSAQAPPSVPLDVYITGPNADLGPLSPALSLDARYSSYSSLIYFDPGTWAVRFTTAGTKQVVANTGAIPIAAGQIRAVTLEKKPDGTWQTSVVEEQP